ncbi:MAG: hypothetical protein OHK0047_10450 [Leptolyngbyaceae cyanobacterium]
MHWGHSVDERYSIKLKRIELKTLENRFKKLEKDYEDLSNQRDRTTNAAEVNNLELQLNNILEDLQKVGIQRDQLQGEIQKLEAEELNHAIPEPLQKLVSLLLPIESEIIAKTYRLSLSQGRPRLVPTPLEALVRQLAELPGAPNEPEPLLQFVNLLLQEPALAVEQRASLKTWAKTQGLDVQGEELTLAKATEVCLMIKVLPRALNDPSLGYVVDAAIAQDPDPWNCDVEPLTTPLSIEVSPDPKCAPGYCQDDLPRVLDALIATCGKHHIPLTELVIQWFLPNELMSLPVEHWQFQSGKHQKEYCGRRCKAVIIRSSDRHFLPHYQVASGDWQKYWTRLLNCQGSKCSEVLVQLNPITGKTQVNWKNARIVGCKFVEHPNPQQQERLWDELLGQGVPIALWTRQAGAQSKKKSLSACTIANLSEALAAHRQKALSHGSEADRLRAASLCLLFDNPFRPFPTLDYESA